MPAMDNAHALVVGIANYERINSLPPTVLKDAQDIHGLLIDPQHCGYPKENVQLLLDKQATLKAFRGALSDLAKRTTEDSTVFFYLSSHGGRIEDGPQAGEYILPVDVDYTSDKTLSKTAISGDEFSKALQSVTARKLVVLFDCCYSGGVGRPKSAAAEAPPELKSGLPEKYYEALQTGRGRVIMASSRETELSWVLPNAVNSLFTEQLLAGLRGGIASEDGLIRIFDLFEYVQPRVTGKESSQHPIFKADLEENFAVALYLGGQKGVVPKVEGEFRYDAFISYVDREPDAAWVWDKIVPKLEEAGLKVAVSGDSEEPGVARVVSKERGIEQAKRTVIVLSPAYLEDNMADFENTIAQTMGIQEGTYRLLPVKIDAFDESRLPTRLSALTSLNLVHPRRADREFDRLLNALKGPLPRR